VVYKVQRGQETFAAKLCRFAAESLGKEERVLFIHRLEREYRILRALQHPKIVRVHALGWHEGLPFYTMDFLDGFPLSVFVREANPTLVERIDLLAEAAGR
jgi:eukaryotic-like serine/threonine-protein kinase